MFVWIFAEWLCCCSAYWEEMSGLFMPVHLFLYLQTMEKLQLYSHQKLCYNSLVLGVSRCTGQEISACREASLGRSKLGRSKLGRNGDCSGTSAPIRLKKEDWKENYDFSRYINYENNGIYLHYNLIKAKQFIKYLD